MFSRSMVLMRLRSVPAVVVSAEQQHLEQPLLMAPASCQLWMIQQHQQQQQQQYRSLSTTSAAKKKKKKTKSGNVRGSRGHGWLHHYRNDGGGRHLQGPYAEGRRPPVEELQAWNQQVLNLGKVTAYFDILVGGDIDAEDNDYTDDTDDDADTVTTTTTTTSIDSTKIITETTNPNDETIKVEEMQVVEKVVTESIDKQHLPVMAAALENVIDVGGSESVIALPASAAAEEKVVVLPSSSSSSSGKKKHQVEHRLHFDIATTAMPMTTRNFLQLCQQSTFGYTNSIFFRLDKRVGLMGGGVVSNTGTTGRCCDALQSHNITTTNDNNDNNNGSAEPTTATTPPSTEPSATTLSSYLPMPGQYYNTDHHLMTHLAGSITMLCPTVQTVDSRFGIVTTQTDAPHLDGYHLVFGQLHPESLDLVQSWVKSIFTKQGRPLTELRIVQCGILNKEEGNDENKTNVATAAENTK